MSNLFEFQGQQPHYAGIEVHKRRRTKQSHTPKVGQPQSFDLTDGQWEGLYTHNDYSCDFGDDFVEVLNWWDIHTDWWSEMERLAKLHGGLEFGDDDFRVVVRHKNCSKPFRVYWRVSNPKRKPDLFDLLATNQGRQL